VGKSKEGVRREGREMEYKERGWRWSNTENVPRQACFWCLKVGGGDRVGAEHEKRAILCSEVGSSR